MILAMTQGNQEFYCVRERLGGMNRMLGGGQRMWHCFTDDENDGVFDRGGMLMTSTGVNLPTSGDIENIVAVQAPYSIDTGEQTWSFVSSIRYDGGRRNAHFTAEVREAVVESAEGDMRELWSESTSASVDKMPTSLSIAGATLTILASAENSVSVRVDTTVDGEVALFRIPTSRR